MAPSSDMGEKQAEATSVSRRAGQLIDPRDRQEQVAMAPAFSVLTIEPLAYTGLFEQVQDFVINYPHGTMAITGLGNSMSNIDLYEQNNPGKTLAPKRVRKTLPALKVSDGLRVTELDCLVIPSPYISKYQAHIQWNAYDIAITPFPPSDPGEAVARTFVNEEVLSKGQLRVLHPGDVIAFHEPNTTEQFCKWEVKRIAYSGLQTLNRSGERQEEKLAKWCLDIPTVMVTVVAMAIMGGLLILFLPDIGDDFIN